jgi:hypothetical protein
MLKIQLFIEKIKKLRTQIKIFQIFQKYNKAQFLNGMSKN